jgi:hypothetical protein
MDEYRNFAKSVSAHLSYFALTIPALPQSASGSALVHRRNDPVKTVDERLRPALSGCVAALCDDT